MIAVVFGCILPDDDVLNSDHSENAISEREVGDLQDNSRQARWRQRSGRDAPHSEADEIRD